MMQEEEQQQQQCQEEPLMLLPVGYTFRPTDRELLFHFLKNKLKDPIAFQPAAPIYDLQLYDYHPKIILDNFGVQGHNDNVECYVFSMRHRKFLRGDRANRILKDNVGYWRASNSKRGGDQFQERRRCGGGGLVGERMNLVYFDTTTTTSTTKGTKKGTKTDWLMNEYKLKPAPDNDEDGSEEDLVLCKIYLNNRQRNKGISNHQQQQYDMQQEQPYLQQQQQQQYTHQEQQPPEQPYLNQQQPQQEQYMQQEQQPPEQCMQQQQPEQPPEQCMQQQQPEQPHLLQQQQLAAVDNQATFNTGTNYSIDAEIDWDELDQLMSQAQQSGMGMISIDDYAY